ncbi:unnamed protein product [Rotaria magnacalcarata]|uniref:Uncharacterized protein n=1 Tax=Rotaria magnacalcarata TaxID=392030 RepID=A0A8S3JBP8_9BILA|nr:unnamed protein product [Rotaria magnacalcarata]CAF5213625.1 unnamed protein product [Rotaria magnacalcarata]
MSSGNVLDQPAANNAGASLVTSNNLQNNNNLISNNNNTVNNNGSSFQPVRNNSDNMGHTFENSMQMFAMKQQPMASPITGTIYTGPPAKYLSNGGMNSNGYATGGPMRPMLPPQQHNRYGSYNGNNQNYNSGGPSMQQQRRQNNSGVDNATNDSVK